MRSSKADPPSLDHLRDQLATLRRRFEGAADRGPVLGHSYVEISVEAAGRSVGPSGLFEGPRGARFEFDRTGLL